MEQSHIYSGWEYYCNLDNCFCSGKIFILIYINEIRVCRILAEPFEKSHAHHLFSL